MNNFINRLKQGWTLMRIIRLGLAIIVLSEAFKNADFLFGALGGLLLFQAVFNYGCCGVGGCDTNRPMQEGDPKKEITFEEIN